MDRASAHRASVGVSPTFRSWDTFWLRLNSTVVAGHTASGNSPCRVAAMKESRPKALSDSGRTAPSPTEARKAFCPRMNPHTASYSFPSTNRSLRTPENSLDQFKTARAGSMQLRSSPNTSLSPPSHYARSLQDPRV
jgi:hypothetical protein